MTDNNKIKYKHVTLGYFETKGDGLEALVKYHNAHYDISTRTITFEEVFKQWSQYHFKTLNNKSATRTYKSAFNHAKPLHKMKFREIKTAHLECAIENAIVGSATKARMKSLFNLMYKYAIKHEIVDKNYAQYCDSVKVEKTEAKIPFNRDEIDILWENIYDIPYVDIILVCIYTGFRPTELTLIKTENVYITEGYIIGGMKTKAGTDRIVPIHPRISHIIKSYYRKGNEFLFSDHNDCTKVDKPLNYYKYKRRFDKVMYALKMKHSPHDTGHTFITLAKLCEFDEYILKRIIGHEIRDVTEGVYTHRSIENLKKEIRKLVY